MGELVSDEAPDDVTELAEGDAVWEVASAVVDDAM